jgi:N-acetylglutamate synthase-like GNAT family acetyltransferase
VADPAARRGDDARLRTPAERDGGIGGALVADATARAFALGAERVFILADDERDAKRLYERLGFRTVWVMHDFVLELDRS